MRMLLLLSIAVYTAASPQPTVRCFQGGQKMHEFTSSKATSEACLKDDVSQVKIVTDYQKNDTGIYAIMSAYRKWTVSDWHECRPKKTLSGSITVIEVDKHMMITSTVYTCDKDCTVNIDKENAQIILHTDGINNFEISGTTVVKAWFKTTATIPLQQTCEHIKIICGRKIMQFHSCFKHHMSCIRYLQTSMVPGRMSNAICQNLELIVVTTVTLIVFSILTLMAKTYLCYLLLPIFIPLTYVYGFIYDKSCKKCKCCGLAYHPFTKCGEHCVCGGRFETSERMKLHREGGLCTGYKSLRSARVLCKSKGSALTLSIILSILLLGFLTPVQGAPVKVNFTIDELPSFVQEQQREVYTLQKNVVYSLIIDLILIALTFLSVVSINYFMYSIANIFAMYCAECDMYHSRSQLRYFGEFTNKCGSCTCGQFEDLNGLTTHKRSAKCLTKYKILAFKNVLLLIVLSLILKDVIIVVESKTLTECLAVKQLEKDCTGPFLPIKECSAGHLQKPYKEISEMLKVAGHITFLDQSLIEKLPTDIDNEIKTISSQTDMHQMILLEVAFLTKHCNFYKSYDNLHSNEQIQWQLLASSNPTEYCKEKNTEILCTCLAGGNCKNIVDKSEEIKTYYTSKKDQRKSDFGLMMTIAKYMVPGTGFSYLANLTASKAYNNIIEYIKAFQLKHPNNFRLESYKMMLSGLLKDVTDLELDNNYSGQVPAVKLGKVRPGWTDMLEQNFDQTAVEDPLRCSEPRILVCMSPRSKVETHEIFICKSTKMFLIDTFGKHLYKLDNSPTTYCVGDKHCHMKYRKLDSAEAEKYRKNHQCALGEYKEPDNYLGKRLQTCKQKASGRCGGDPGFKVTLCDDELVYPEVAKQSPKNSAFPNERCFESTCKYGQYPYNMEMYSNCTWESSKSSGVRPRIISHENFQEYKDQIVKKITSELVIHKFTLSENLPYFVPTKKYLTLHGVSTSDGMDGTYVEFEIPALTGTSAGYSVMTPEGLEMFDFVVYIKNSAIYNQYSYSYSTGPTIAINNKHTEHCTNDCPKSIPHAQGWATFSKERTSQWGCEEFGCLAVNEGCLYGSCQDVIKKEMDIYTKAGNDQTTSRVCISMNHETYCHDIEATTPIVSDRIELQYKTVQSQTLPRNVAMKAHKIYTGQINDLGSFGKYCGNVQVTHNQTLGLADVKFDYTCHAAQRKDVIIRKCFENNYQSCKLLKENTDLILTEQSSTLNIADNKKITGTLAIKAIFGDFNYKSYSKELEFDADISCVGCFNCIHGIICELDIKTSVETSCQLKSQCAMYTNRLILKPSVEKYSLTLRCDRILPDNKLQISICDKAIESHITIANTEEKLELSTGEQSTYVHEEDLRCATWLCKLREEGLSFIFNPILSWLGSYTWPVIITITVILVLALAIYIFMPICFKIRDTLKKNEYEYLQEIKSINSDLPLFTRNRIKPFA